MAKRKPPRLAIREGFENISMFGLCLATVPTHGADRRQALTLCDESTQNAGENQAQSEAAGGVKP